jgi:hypothetical protein
MKTKFPTENGRFELELAFQGLPTPNTSLPPSYQLFAQGNIDGGRSVGGKLTIVNSEIECCPCESSFKRDPFPAGFLISHP